MPEIKIYIYHYAAVTRRYYPKTKADAKKIYDKYSLSWEQYTQLIVDGQIFNTVQAERFFKPKKRESVNV